MICKLKGKNLPAEEEKEDEVDKGREKLENIKNLWR